MKLSPSIMEIELHLAVSLREGTFNVLVAPVEMLVDTLKDHQPATSTSASCNFFLE